MEWSFNTGQGGGQEHLVSNTKKYIQPPIMHKNNPPPPAHTKKFTKSSSYFKYPNSLNVFQENNLFMTFIKHVCQYGIKEIHPRVSQKSPPPLSVQTKF